MKQRGVSELTTPNTTSVSEPQAGPRPNSSPPTAKSHSYWLGILLLTLTYIVAATVGDVLKAPDSPASILWPATGISLAALLIGGLRLWPGIWLGAFLYLLFLATPTVETDISALIASGATLQALLGALLTYRLYHNPTQLTQEWHIARFLLLGGPVACLVSPTIATLGLYGAGYLAGEQAVGTWLLWWTADSLGVLLFAPLVFASPIGGALFPKNGIRIAVPLLITAALLLSGNTVMKRLEESQAHDAAERMMEETYESGLKLLPMAIEPLSGVERFFATDEAFNKAEITAFANYIAQQPAVISVDWAPRVKHTERRQFEASLPREHPDNHTIFERDAQGQPFPSGRREEYFPVSFTTGTDTNTVTLGYDHSSDSRRRAAMTQARDSGKVTVTPLLPGSPTMQPAVLAFTPVYRPDFKDYEASMKERRDALVGFFVCAFDVKQLLSSLDRVASHHQLLYSVTDISPGEKPQQLLNTLSPGIKSHWSRRVAFVNRTWQLEMQPTGAYWQPWSSYPSRLYLALSVLGAFLVSLATLSAAGRNTATTIKIIERTAELARELRAREAAEEEIRRLNLDLEQQVVERTRALEELHGKEEQLSAIVDNLPYGLVTIDAYGVIHSANPAIEEVLGYRPDELIGSNVSILMPEPDRGQHDSYISRYLKSGDASAFNSGREMTGQHKDGHLITLELNLSDYQVNGERFFIGSLWDISERKRFIDELTQARQGAEQASRAKSSFLAVMSHEIRTPMNGVIGLVDVLSHSRLSDYQAELVVTIRESATTLLDIIDDILDFSKIDAGRMTIEHNPVCIAEIVEGLCSTLQPDAANKNVAMSLFISPEIPPLVLSDSVRLRQALGNLIGNAIKFSANQTRRKGYVCCRITLTEEAPQKLVFEIIDNGIGMTQSTLDQLFTPFTQAEASTTRRFGGTGLGLAITQRLVELMQGEITVTSRPGVGSHFTVTLPFEPAPEQPAKDKSALSGIQCIVIDDADINTADLCAYLEDAGAEVMVTADTHTAVELSAGLITPVVIQDAKQQRPAVDPVLADIKRLHHLQLTRGRRLRARLEDTNVVSLDYPILRRQSLIHAISLAAGQADPHRFHEAPLPELTADTAPPNIAEARAQDRLILVAEDDALNQRVILQQLALLGYAAEIAPNGTEALRLWRNGGYALLLTDLQMPNMDGYTLARTIRREEGGVRRTPILALTANALREEENQAGAAGMDGYLTKPLQLQRLREVLEIWLPKRELTPLPEAPTQPGRSGPPVDVTILHDMVGDDPETVFGLLTDYLESLRHLTQELHSVYKTNDIRQICAITHKLKSSSRLVGALFLGELCADIEHAAKAEDKQAIDEIIPQYEAAVTAVEAEINDLLKEGQTS